MTDNPSRLTKPAAMAITQLRMFLIMTSARSTIQPAIPDSTAVDFMQDTTNPGCLHTV
jgi:hypothetical protein